MPVDPKECRKHALFCTELAAAAQTTRSKALFLEPSQSWEMLAIQLEDAITEIDDIRSYVRELRAHGTPPSDRRPKDMGGTFLQHAPRSNYLRQIGAPSAPDIVEVHRRPARAAVISSDHSNNWRRCISFDQPIRVVSPAATALFVLNVEGVELADKVAKNNDAVTRHNASQFSRDSAAAARSSAARLLLPRSLALLSCVHRRTSPRLPAPPSVGRIDQMAKALQVGKLRCKDAELV
jgi:hypothetical protein